MTFKELIKSKRFNCSTLAREIGVAPATVSLWAKGLTEPTSETIVKIANACEVEPSIVFNSLLVTKKEKQNGV